MGSPEQTGTVNIIPTTRKLAGIMGRLQCKTAAYSDHTHTGTRVICLSLLPHGVKETHNDVCVQHPETHRRDHEEVRRHQLLDMVLQERPPSLRWRIASPHPVLGNRCLGHLDSEHEQFPV